MFTGLVVERGRVVASGPRRLEEGLWLEIEISQELQERLPIGASLAVEGCCLTVVKKSDDGVGESSDEQSESGGDLCSVGLELSSETLRRTTLCSLVAGDRVNLEPAMTLGDALGGHWVQGHVDTTSDLVEREDADDFSTFWWTLPAGYEASFVEKGSVTVDGVSLTVAAISNGLFSVALIPHTLAVTTLGDRRPGSRSNIEVDVLAKYVAKCAARGAATVTDPSIQERVAVLEAELERLRNPCIGDH